MILTLENTINATAVVGYVGVIQNIFENLQYFATNQDVQSFTTALDDLEKTEKAYESNIAEYVRALQANNQARLEAISARVSQFNEVLIALRELQQV